ncbi:MAG: LysM domain-containing protein, partial [Dehalococcoidia bacterium]
MLRRSRSRRYGTQWRRRAIQSRRSPRFAIATAAGIALAAVLALAGCGGSTQSESTLTPFPTPPVTPTPTPNPATPTPAEPAPLTFEYEVQAGDSVAALADRFGTTLEAIVAANDLADPAAIAIGEMLTIPNASSTPVPTPSPTPTPENPVGTDFAMPIAGGCLAT